MIENKTNEVYVAPPIPREFKVGDVVFANQVIVRSFYENEHEFDIWIAAAQGQLGVVTVTDHPKYTVNFVNSGNVDVHVDDINLYQGHVVKVTE